MISDSTHVGGLAQKWSHVLKIQIDVSRMIRAFTNINKVTKVVKYRAFQYRLIHNAVMLNDRLVHWAFSDTNRCCLCKTEKETPLHFFVQCTKMKEL